MYILFYVAISNSIKSENETFENSDKYSKTSSVSFGVYFGRLKTVKVYIFH
jgi:hypothetical protein